MSLQGHRFLSEKRDCLSRLKVKHLHTKGDWSEQNDECLKEVKAWMQVLPVSLERVLFCPLSSNQEGIKEHGYECEAHKPTMVYYSGRGRRATDEIHD